MNKFIKIFLVLLALIILFHLCIITKLIPYDITWGGRLQNDTEMYVFETISILINVFLAWVLLIKGNFVKFKFSDKITNIILWIFFTIFILNTIGNAFATTNFEKLFAFLTGLFAFFLYKIIQQGKLEKNNPV